jgi:hypothetical protein
VLPWQRRSDAVSIAIWYAAIKARPEWMFAPVSLRDAAKVSMRSSRTFMTASATGRALQ